MNEKLIQLKHNLERRVFFEKHMINWFTFVFISILTGGIFGVYYFVKRIVAVDAFIVRKSEFYAIISDITGCPVPVNFHKVKPLRWLKVCLFMFFTVGLYFFIYSYRINNVWKNLQDSEFEFYGKLSEVLREKGISSCRVPFKYNRSLEMSYSANLILSLITGCLWLFVWDYKIHTAPNKLYPQVHMAENYIFSLIYSD